MADRVDGISHCFNRLRAVVLSYRELRFLSASYRPRARGRWDQDQAFEIPGIKFRIQVVAGVNNFAHQNTGFATDVREPDSFGLVPDTSSATTISVPASGGIAGLPFDKT